MATGATTTSCYEDFEPFCKWQRMPVSDTLEVHLHGFRKNQLKITLSNLGVLRIAGERLLDDSKRSRFCKEIKLTKDHKTNEIHAKLSGGILYIVMPKKTVAMPPGNQEIERMRTKTVPLNKNSSEINAPMLNPYKLSRFGFRYQDLASSKICTRDFAIAFAFVIGVTSFAIYKYRQRHQCPTYNVES